MANQVYKKEEVELLDESVITVRSLNIKRLRKAMELVTQLADVDEADQIAMIELMCKAAVIVIEPTNKDFFQADDEDEELRLAARAEELEEVVDVFTLQRIIEIGTGAMVSETGGVDPNLPKA